VDGERTCDGARLGRARRPLPRLIPTVIINVIINVIITAVAAAGFAVTGSASASATVSSPPSPTPPAGDLRSAVAEQTDAVRAARDDLARTAQEASAALEAYSVAVQAQQLARAEQERRQQALLSAETDLVRRRAELGRWAQQAYRSGNGLAANPTLVTILGGSTAEISRGQRVLELAGRQSSRVISQLQQALAVQREASRTADAAAEATERTVLAARAAQQARDAAVRRQKAGLDRLEARLAITQTAVEDAERQARMLAQARAYAGLLDSGPGARGDNRVTGPVGTCAGGQTELYPNGEIPLEALCPLWGAPGHYLRADAAYAFDQLSTEYAKTFGRPICVTDSYRSYAEQVQVKAEKPSLAATPGTSNHGWGTALDLCGGIQDFDRDQHHWFALNAPAFGWFHPSWAARDGSKPEPWHWEFGG